MDVFYSINFTEHNVIHLGGLLSILIVGLSHLSQSANKQKKNRTLGISLTWYEWSTIKLDIVLLHFPTTTTLDGVQVLEIALLCG